MLPPGSPASWGLADAVAAGVAEPIDWMDVELPELDLVVTVPRGPLRMPLGPSGRMMAASLSYAEQRRLCALLGAISVTHDVLQALWKKAAAKLVPDPLVRTASDAAAMGDLDFLTRENDAFDAQMQAHAAELAAPGAFARGFYKAWIIGLRMSEQGPHGAENEGFEYPNGTELQHEGGAHNDAHLDYSQWAWDLARRRARRLSTGEALDLREVFVLALPGLADRIRVDYPDELAA
jgi:hypothetical protein